MTHVMTRHDKNHKLHFMVFDDGWFDVSELLYDALRLHFTLLHKYVSLFVCCLFCRLDHLWGPPLWGSLCEFSHCPCACLWSVWLDRCQLVYRSL